MTKIISTSEYNNDSVKTTWGCNLDIIVYIDLYFVINFCMDLVILVIVSKMTQTRTTLLRYSFASLFGAIISCLLLMNQNFSVLIQIIVSYGIGAIGVVLLAFRFESIKKVAVLLMYMYGVTIVIGGLLCCILLNSSFGSYVNELLGMNGRKSVSILMLLLSVGLILLCLPYLIRYLNSFRKRENNIYEVSIVLEKKRVKAKALLDTGNHLREPLTNRPVIIVEKTLLKQIMTRELLEYTTRIKVIPYRSIGKEHGTMYGLVLDGLEVTVDNVVHKHEDVVACVYEGTLSSKKDYQLILHEELM